MSKIALRSYNREIENMIDRGDSLEAVAHCKHILTTFPKHIDTYRLLGKALLESQKYGDAADIFQRVLSSVPDDFISHIGMSIVREDEGNLDASIWHMERAFEIQPSNSAVQDELKRLYGRRDGVEPSKIRLTRGALVRMYTRGELYQQAIAEIRAALSEDPLRIDLEVILARLYFLTDRKVEATEICSKLISKLPYCYEANRILADILPDTTRAEDAKIFRQRIHELDPYFSESTITQQDIIEVPDNAVTLDYLVYRGNQKDDSQPDWAKSIGVQTEEFKNDTGEWNFNTPAPPPTPAEVQSPDLTVSSQTEQSGEDTSVKSDELEPEIPDWMKKAGWEKSDSASENHGAVDFELEDIENIHENISAVDSDDHIEPADLPDWIKQLEPQQNMIEDEPEDLISIEKLKALLPDNLEKAELNEASIGDGIANIDITSSIISDKDEQEKNADADLNIPAWLSELETTEEPRQFEDVQFETDQTEITDSQEPNEIPDWLNDLEAVSAKEDSTEIEDLREFQFSAESQEPEFQEQQEAHPPEQQLEEPDLSLSDTAPLKVETVSVISEETPEPELEDSESQILQAEVVENTISEFEPSETDQFLQEDVLSDELLIKNIDELLSSSELEKVGDDQELSEGSKTGIEETISKEGLPDWLSLDDLTQPDAEIKEADITDEIAKPEWLSEFLNSEDLNEAPVSASEELPEWISAETVDDSKTLEMAEQELEQIPDWLNELGEPTEIVNVSAPDTNEKLSTQSKDSMSGIDETLTWMKDLISENEMEEPGSLVAEEKLVENEISIPQKQDEATTEAETESELPIPDWLARLEEEVQDVKIEDAANENIPFTETNLGQDLEFNQSEASPTEEIELENITFPDQPPFQGWSEISETENESDATIETSLPATEKAPELFKEEAPEATSSETIATSEKLQSANALINKGEIEKATDILNEMISEGTDLDALIHDIREALYRFPIDISLWQLLGDAYARHNQLQEALDAYTKAEELIR